ncbi:hypothetical protein N7541_004367 [Penicillium brevicompactum]|uniref:Uncharacterized protein n=1 Tax=Penicillium brevicompactum TaxID=5074 RepID=A0A9W9RDB7_PENBR|nr:hypothetical protein N7541_004367 [Penicillium brevicompactum]
MPRKNLPFWAKTTQSEKPSKLPTTERDGNKEEAFASSSKKRVSGTKGPKVDVTVNAVVIEDYAKANHKDEAQKGTQTPIYPDPTYGEFNKADEKPGFWAKRAAEAPWGLGATDLHQPGTLLNRLSRMPLQREPILQSDTEHRKRAKLSGEEFDHQIGRQKDQINALIGQAVGKRLDSDNACERCVSLNGKFNACVSVPGMNECASCTWDLQWKCTFANRGEKKQGLAPQNGILNEMLALMKSIDSIEPQDQEHAARLALQKQFLAQQIFEEAERLGCF